ncbi:tRNA 5-methoxyuridine(34)/uridine 5-oxyacetic acid(34) synthase CmoB [Alteromonas pelagimontana]|uniref:tRNA U34 carboxymethyltransferase n=1 Tax=Alteromonas pelagimontana TaxID=1858656 RepID=A0A6M4MB51_9ALTE|nr:tRNA 5-methoxyuridine(34)/uridine 5-oxyacetic acid(34) synthase CmoB [Alteromonas pelagimontana]QJR79386.1 tRNA 5-methoxyuridine(34)/uridine 5-oxyacetic acid(34) synthase CmoB [Alteromonas pelagimontana]
MNNTAVTWFEECYQSLLGTPLSHWLETLPGQISHWLKHDRHGEFDKWTRLIEKMPHTTPSKIEFASEVRIGCAEDIDDYTSKQLQGLLKQFMPWRKGPYFLHDIHIDTEWRSDWKWDRVVPHISPLESRTVLDVGCGSGYHMWRMLGQNASRVIGIDPTVLFFMQFQIIKRFAQDSRIHFLPLGIEQMQALDAFDTVFSMGVLYHRKDPLQFLTQLKHQLRPGGELVLETLVVEGDENTVFMPGERYAQMRNVWFLPSVAALIIWLERLGFINIKMVDVNVTRLDEQRQTPWMTSQSLKDFLDPEDLSRTIEGYPAPQRAVIVATRK